MNYTWRIVSFQWWKGNKLSVMGRVIPMGTFWVCIMFILIQKHFCQTKHCSHEYFLVKLSPDLTDQLTRDVKVWQIYCISKSLMIEPNKSNWEKTSWTCDTANDIIRSVHSRYFVRWGERIWCVHNSDCDRFIFSLGFPQEILSQSIFMTVDRESVETKGGGTDRSSKGWLVTAFRYRDK